MTEQNHSTKRRGSAQTQRRGDRTRGTPPEKQARKGSRNPEWLRAFLTSAALFFAALDRRVRRIGARDDYRRKRGDKRGDQADVKVEPELCAEHLLHRDRQ